MRARVTSRAMRMSGRTIRMDADEWNRLDDLADRARTSRAKVLRVALAELDLSPEEIGRRAWGLSDHKFNGGSPAASESSTTEEAAAAVA